MDDLIIIRMLFERSESGLDEMQKKYGRLYRGVLRGVLGDEGDVEECENDLLMAVWNTIPPESPQCLSAYICRLARNIGINRYKGNTRKKRGAGEYAIALSEIEDCVPDIFSEIELEEKDRAELISSTLEKFVRELDAESRTLFVRRYIYMESVKSLAQRFEISEGRVSIKLFRARKKLKKILEKEGVYVVQ